MPNDTAITRLLYAMLSQKCLKDIDWNLVARDPILSQEITNGHAARMRYSRFKKQMEGTPATTRKPRKNKVSKSSSSASSSKVKSRKRSEPDVDAEGERVKEERCDGYFGAGDSFNSTSTSSAREMQTPDPESEMGMSMNMHSTSRGIKKEHGMNMNTNARYQPTTPLTSFSTPNYSRFLQEASASPSPNTSFNHMAADSHTHGHPNHDDEMFASFGSPTGRGAGMPVLGMGLSMSSPGLMFGEVHAPVHESEHNHQSQLAYNGYGSHMGEAGTHLGYDGMWQQENLDHGLVGERGFEMPSSGGGKEEDRCSVKSEPRW